MTILNLPAWLNKHLYSGSNFYDLSTDQVADLKESLGRFNIENPEVSIVIPAWNEEKNIFRTLSSLASTTTSLNVEIVVVNNNSTDKTQQILDELGVKSYFEPNQGISYTRQTGLLKARGKYHLCADSDTFYPPQWIDQMVKPLKKENGVVGVYGRYSFIPPAGQSRVALWIYEKLTGVIVRLRKQRREHINFLGFNMGFITSVGIETGGFIVAKARKFDNSGDDFVDESEDGRMAVNLKTRGSLKLITNSDARAFTSSRRLLAEGGVFTSFFKRFNLHVRRIGEYVASPPYKD